MRRMSVLGIAALLVAVLTVGANAQDSDEMYYYEMFVSPDIDGQCATTAGDPRPMRMLGDGFGSRAAGDFANGAGLQLDGTVRFIDSGAHGRNGFVVPLAKKQGSVYLRMRVNKDTTGPGTSVQRPFTFGFAIQGSTWTGTIAAKMDTGKIQLVRDGLVSGAEATVDMTTWRIVRFQVDTRATVHGGTDGAAMMRVFVDNVADTDTPVIDWTPTQGWWQTVLRYEAIWGSTDGDSIFYILGTDTKTMQADFVVDWIRITRSEDLAGNTGHPHGLIPPQDNNTWNLACDWRVYPHYYTNTVVVKNGTTATPGSIAYQVINTSYDSAAEMTWTVEEVDSGGVATDYAWLDLDKTGGTLAAAQGTGEVLTVSFNSEVSALPAGWTEAYLKFGNTTCALEETRKILVAVNDPASWVVYEYCGDVPPTEADSAGTDQRFRVWGFLNSGVQYGTKEEADNAYGGAVVDDADAWNGKAFRIHADDTSDEFYHVFLSDDNAGNGVNDGLAGLPVIDQLVGATVVTRMKTVKPDDNTTNEWSNARDMGVMLSGGGTRWVTSDAENCSDVWATIRCRATDIDSSGVFSISDGLRYQAQGYVLDAQKGISYSNGEQYDYHIVRLAVLPGINDSQVGSSPAVPNGCSNFYGRKIMMWLDESTGWTGAINPTLAVDNKLTKKAASQYDRYAGFQFGIQERQMAVDYSWDWITFTNAGAFGPGEEQAVIGRSLIPSSTRCGEPPEPPEEPEEAIGPDADEDGDVDQDDFAQFQICYSGADAYPTSPENCDRFDTDTSGMIDATDFAAFTACATGPGIPVTAGTAPNCDALAIQSWEANNGYLGHLCGSLLGTDDWRCVVTDTPCWMSYGPYVRLQAGDYAARFYLAIDDIAGNDDVICTLDIFDSTGIEQLAAVVLTRSDFTESGVYQSFIVPFTVEVSNHHIEFRIIYGDGNPDTHEGTCYAQLDLDKIDLLGKAWESQGTTSIPYTVDTFDIDLDDWTASVWKASTTQYDYGDCEWSNFGNPPGSVTSTGNGSTSSGDGCTREGGVIEKAASTVGHTNLWLEYDLYFDCRITWSAQGGHPAYPSCSTGCSSNWVEGDCLDKLAVYVSTDGGTSWTLLQQVYAADVEQKMGHLRQVKLPAEADNNADVRLKFVTQFNSYHDTGYVDNIGLIEVEE